MKEYIKLLSWAIGMFFKTLVSLVTLYILATSTTSFAKISLISGIASIIWIIDIPFLIEQFSLKSRETKL